jgi:hypothetical protein
LKSGMLCVPVVLGPSIHCPSIHPLLPTLSRPIRPLLCLHQSKVTLCMFAFWRSSRRWRRFSMSSVHISWTKIPHDPV